jgi:hypothetical protein
MGEYLSSRAVLFREEAAIVSAFRRRFYTDDCRRDGRVETLRAILKEVESEELVEVLRDGIEPLAVTRVSLLKPAEARLLRYHLRSVDGGWLIRHVDVECGRCRGKDEFCSLCGGSGWISGNLRKEQWESAGPQDSTPRWRSTD